MVSLFQVGNLTTDVAFWGPPEAMTEQHERRPVYVVNTASGASDLAGSMAGALAAASVAWRSPNATYADELLGGARELYGQAKKFEGSYTAKFKCAARLLFPFVVVPCQSSHQAPELLCGKALPPRMHNGLCR